MCRHKFVLSRRNCEYDREKGEKAFAIQGDATNSGDAKRIVETPTERYGKLDVLVNVFGIAGGLGILESIVKKFGIQ